MAGKYCLAKEYVAGFELMAKVVHGGATRRVTGRRNCGKSGGADLQGATVSEII